MEPRLLLKVMCVSGESYDIHTKNGIGTCVATTSRVAGHLVIFMRRPSNPVNSINFAGRQERAFNEGVV